MGVSPLRTPDFIMIKSHDNKIANCYKNETIILFYVKIIIFTIFFCKIQAGRNKRFVEFMDSVLKLYYSQLEMLHNVRNLFLTLRHLLLLFTVVYTPPCRFAASLLKEEGKTCLPL